MVGREQVCGPGETADLSTALRSGRDDKGEAYYCPQRRFREQKPRISPLRCASVEMTKGWAVIARCSGQGIRSRRSLRYAPSELRSRWQRRGRCFRGKWRPN